MHEHAIRSDLSTGRQAGGAFLLLACCVGVAVMVGGGVGGGAAVAATKPAIKKPVMFDTPQADAILAQLKIFPPEHPINQPVTDWPVHPRSKAIVASVGADKKLRYNADMAFILVPPNQPRQPVGVIAYPEESDPGPFPIPNNTPIEGWPLMFGDGGPHPAMTLRQVQADAGDLGGDRHAIVVDPTRGVLYEFFRAKRGDRGWTADQASVFDLKTNSRRPRGWTSADAAGLPIFPLVVRYDELKRGEINHAMRVTVRKTRKAYVDPATHHASRHKDRDYPRMGERLRLRADFDLSDFSDEAQVILQGLKTYGMLVADNGIEWAISVTPDPRIPGLDPDLHDELRQVKGHDFEVVVAPETH